MITLQVEMSGLITSHPIFWTPDVQSYHSLHLGSNNEPVTNGSGESEFIVAFNLPYNSAVRSNSDSTVLGEAATCHDTNCCVSSLENSLLTGGLFIC